MRWLWMLALPVLCMAQEFQFRQEYGSIPVEINGWHPYQPWTGGFSKSAPEFCDINSDGIKDLFVGCFMGNIFHFEGFDSLGAYSLSFVTAKFDDLSFFAFPWNGSSTPCFGDLNGDSLYDLIVGDQNGHVHYYRNIGNPQNQNMQWVTDTLVPIGPPWCLSPTLVDIDGDSKLDIIGGWQHLTYYHNSGTLQNPSFTFVTDNFAGVNVSGNASPSFVDIDTDGDLDLFVGDENGHIWFYRNDGTPQNYNFTYVTNNYFNIDVGDYASPEFADLDGDGDYDLLVGRECHSLTNSPGDIFYYKNIGTPTNAQWQWITTNFLSLDVGQMAASATTDIDADLDRDIFIQNTGDRLSYYKNTGTLNSANFIWITDSYQNISVNDAYPKFGDLDGDGDPDLLMGEAAIPGPPGMYVFRNRGTAQNALFYLLSNNYLPGIFTQFTVTLAPALADIDADDDLDLFVGVANNNFYYFENTGSPFLPQFTMMSSNWQNVYPPNWPNGQLIPEFYDIDHDGDLDLFCGTLHGWNLLFFYRNVGTESNAQMVFEDSLFLGEGFNHFTSVDIFDIDGDGDGDFMCSTYNGGMVFFRNVTGESPVPPGPKYHPLPQRQITILPNPGNSGTTISYVLSHPQHVNLSVYNLLGSRLATLVNGLQQPGSHVASWDAKDRASGIYLVKLASPEFTTTQKVVIVK
jgi:hypothetical protein